MSIQGNHLRFSGNRMVGQRLSGEIMLGPDSRMPPFRGWRAIQTKTVAETEQMSRRMAKQQYDRMRSLQSMSTSPPEDAATRSRQIADFAWLPDASRRKTNFDTHDAGVPRAQGQLFYQLIANEPDLTRTSLVIEQKEAPIGNAAFAGKRRGLADMEVNEMAQLAESVA